METRKVKEGLCPACGCVLVNEVVKGCFQLLEIPETDSLIKLNVFDCPKCNKQIAIRTIY